MFAFLTLAIAAFRTLPDSNVELSSKPPDVTDIEEKIKEALERRYSSQKESKKHIFSWLKTMKLR
ncbi:MULTISPECIES: hypothetical protein [Nostocales]|uniref:Uncharacterized protein n=1 Tax=Tolypothrix bouteillei VB521301 TaxID=1479485 RepID=A0A0C1QWS2_9CYAN